MPAISPLLDELVKRGGSDLHLAAGCPPLARIRGELVALRDQPLDAKDLEPMLIELVTAPQRARLAADFDLDFSVAHDDASRFRASYFVKRGGLAAVLRHVPQRVPTLAELGCPEVLWRLADRRAGLVIVAGASCSGKTTTVAAMIDHINKTRACHVLTLEDPIEFVHEPLRAQVTQREIGTHVPSLAVALKNAAREDPDVVAVAELKSAAAWRLALELARSGALVVATVQSSGIAAALEQIVAMFPEDEVGHARGLLADTLVGGVAQVLVRTSEGKGRSALHEILVATGAALAQVREGKLGALIGVMQSGQSQGMQTLDTALERLMAASRIAPEAALELAQDKEAFAKIVGRLRPDLVDPPS